MEKMRIQDQQREEKKRINILIDLLKKRINNVVLI